MTRVVTIDKERLNDTISAEQPDHLVSVDDLSPYGEVLKSDTEAGYRLKNNLSPVQVYTLNLILELILEDLGGVENASAPPFSVEYTSDKLTLQFNELGEKRNDHNTVP